MKNLSSSIGKPEQGCINEDAVIAREDVIAVSDGAGGGGLFAERWSAYLLNHLPATPISSAEELDNWIGVIWEVFYNQCEEYAKQLGGLSLDKFYDEGSFATLVAVWRLSDSECKWMSFGDSVAFHYNYSTKLLEHSFGSLADFAKPPYLINCKDELLKEGFCNGLFHTDSDSIVFVASDALAHYVMMMYEMENIGKFKQELDAAESKYSKNSNYIKVAKAIGEVNFEKDVINRLIHTVGHPTNFRRHIQSLIKKGLISFDDYSIAMFCEKSHSAYE